MLVNSAADLKWGVKEFVPIMFARLSSDYRSSWIAGRQADHKQTQCRVPSV